MSRAQVISPLSKRETQSRKPSVLCSAFYRSRKRYYPASPIVMLRCAQHDRAGSHVQITLLNYSIWLFAIFFFFKSLISPDPFKLLLSHSYTPGITLILLEKLKSASLITLTWRFE